MIFEDTKIVVGLIFRRREFLKVSFVFGCPDILLKNDNHRGADSPECPVHPLIYPSATQWVGGVEALGNMARCIASRF
jgi:hypothetical protein